MREGRACEFFAKRNTRASKEPEYVFRLLPAFQILREILPCIAFLDSDDVVNFAIRYILLTFVAGGLKVLVFGSADVGSYFTGFFTGVVGFLTPVGLTLLVIYFWKKYFASMM